MQARLFAGILIALAMTTAHSAIRLRMHDAIIEAPSDGQSRAAWLRQLRAYREGMRAGLDRGLYDRPELGWQARAITCHFTFLFDRSIYNPEEDRYTLDTFLDDGEREFGGYDALLLWCGYPRLGVDERNQFDLHRDAPGGLEGLGGLVRRAHERNVRVFIAYNPWDRGTRREGKSDEETLAGLAAELSLNGVFLDTMSAGNRRLFDALSAARPGAVLSPEIAPPLRQLPLCLSSWAQWFPLLDRPSLYQFKWIEPRHMQYSIGRWDLDRTRRIQEVFWNGSGMLVWENVFGTYYPWTARERALWRRASRILRYAAELVLSDRQEPFARTLQPAVFANRWQDRGRTLWLLMNTGQPLVEAPLLSEHGSVRRRYFDLWNGEELHVRSGRVLGSLDGIGAILCIDPSRVDEALLSLLEAQRNDAAAKMSDNDARNFLSDVTRPRPVAPTARHHGAPPPGMAYVPGGILEATLTHPRRESGCYPDPGTPPDNWKRFIWGNGEPIVHHVGPLEVRSFYMDETEVTNAQYAAFLSRTAYRPKCAVNFLKHWPDGKMPTELADLPVVFVDLDDARAYAAWAGKRLPTEEEWQWAAQGPEGRARPWGNIFDASRCNMAGRLLPARSCPEGRAPSGLYNLAGNAWEWTESQRDDGHCRWCIIRGGSWFKAQGSNWYTEGGPQPNATHTKFLLLWPGLDRCGTVGFRCVVDAR